MHSVMEYLTILNYHSFACVRHEAGLIKRNLLILINLHATFQFLSYINIALSGTVIIPCHLVFHDSVQGSIGAK